MRPLAITLLLPLALTPQDTRALRPIDIGARKALVIGNANYPDGKLPRVPTDAGATRDTLSRLGFQVTLAENLNRRQLDDAVETFARRLGERDLALVYFAGHGMQVGGENYLIPVDFQGRSEADVQYETYPAAKLRTRLEQTRARVRVLVFDACRNNPYRFKRDGTNGLAAMPSNAEGTAILFAAADGQTADDGLFTPKFLAALETPGLPLDQVFKRVQAAVWDESRGRQLPALYDQVVGRLVLKAGAPVGAVSPDVESTYWQACDKQRGEYCKIYLELYPSGRYAPLARVHLRGVEPAPVAAPSAADRGPSFVNPTDGLTYVRIPAGTFMMGCSPGDNECDDDEKPPVRVTITKPFYLGESEVTQAAFQRVMGSNPSQFRGADRPVERVSQIEASEYCTAIGGRLPTEAEWEWAARGGLTTARYGNPDQVGWYRENGGLQTHPVKQKRPNAYGLYDMLGNVWELTSAWYTEKPIGGVDPQGVSSGKANVLRGGVWHFGYSQMRASNRGGSLPDWSDSGVGFRCVMN